MARPVKLRNILFPRINVSYIPKGGVSKQSEQVNILAEEFEAIVLVDYEKMPHLRASEIMGVSRPTLTRIYEKARAKIASALVESRQLNIKGGNIVMKQEWYTCSGCGCVFNEYGNNPGKCPLCSCKKIKTINK